MMSELQTSHSWSLRVSSRTIDRLYPSAVESSGRAPQNQDEFWTVRRRRHVLTRTCLEKDGSSSERLTSSRTSRALAHDITERVTYTSWIVNVVYDDVCRDLDSCAIQLHVIQMHFPKTNILQSDDQHESRSSLVIIQLVLLFLQFKVTGAYDDLLTAVTIRNKMMRVHSDGIIKNNTSIIISKRHVSAFWEMTCPASSERDPNVF